MKRKSNRSKKSTAPKGKFPDSGYRAVACRHGSAKVAWRPRNVAELEATVVWEWNANTQDTRSEPMDGNALEALTKIINAIADSSETAGLWREQVFKDLSNVPRQQEP